MKPDYKIEDIGGGVGVAVSKEHTFGTDAFLLSYFASAKKHETACDLCSGCGIVPLLWLRDGDGPKIAYALDIQEQAVEQMRLSAGYSNLDRFVPVLGDLLDLKGVFQPGAMDIVTCNPPYNAPDTGLISAGDSRRAARHEVMCDINGVCSAAAGLLRFHGRFCLCHLPERLADVLEAMRRNNLEPKRLRFVQQRAGDAPWLFLAEGKLGAKPFLKIEPPLIMRNGDGASAEMERIYGLYGRV